MGSTPPWVRAKTRYLPGITATPSSRLHGEGRTILVVYGRGGQPGDGEAMARAAKSCPDWRWRVMGPCSVPRHLPENLDMLGWVVDPDREIAAATVVVGAAGDGLVGSILAADRPFICIPEDRPFGEQQAMARGLNKVGAAIVLSRWPDVAQWDALIAEAIALGSEARRRLHDPDGVRVAAQWLQGVADRQGPAWDQAA
ncbi:hypothetical protein U5A82_18730 [Sphingobium sp. CR2-8]|uniref:hypothetical protein n=1 Tax=Sphingobium sp. CR2-8 TaxID=1306534 RepID=UPI002DB69418|nr:hypothetical protein [Sphingobium sp. CR2-8]MEC3912435.1 hypothetical protein [Sphingobium sp. CR2-8]